MNLMKYFESAIYRLSIHRFLERESEIENKRERERGKREKGENNKRRHAR